MDPEFKERAKTQTREALAKNTPNLLDELPASLADLAGATVYLEAVQVLLQESPINVMEILALLKRAVDACQHSEEKQRAMLDYVKKVRGNMITMEDIRF